VRPKNVLKSVLLQTRTTIGFECGSTLCTLFLIILLFKNEKEKGKRIYRNKCRCYLRCYLRRTSTVRSLCWGCGGEIKDPLARMKEKRINVWPGAQATFLFAFGFKQWVCALIRAARFDYMNGGRG
jgi:hypothetical protein